MNLLEDGRHEVRNLDRRVHVASQYFTLLEETPSHPPPKLPLQCLSPRRSRLRARLFIRSLSPQAISTTTGFVTSLDVPTVEHRRCRSRAGIRSRTKTSSEIV